MIIQTACYYQRVRGDPSRLRARDESALCLTSSLSCCSFLAHLPCTSFWVLLYEQIPQGERAGARMDSTRIPRLTTVHLGYRARLRAAQIAAAQDCTLAGVAAVCSPEPHVL